MPRHIFFVSIAALLSLGLAGAASAQDASSTMSQSRSGWYGTLSGNWLVPRDYDGEGQEWKTYNGYGVYGALGHRLNESWRAEAEIGYGTVENDRISVGNSSTKVDGDIHTYSATGALYYDTPTLFSLQPYLGAGAGVVRQRNERNAVTVGGRSFPEGSTPTDLTAFAEAGLSFDLGNALELVPSYRYQWIDDGRDGFDDSGIHVARLGLRYWFN
ncbi:porin family protein [Ferrovibrio terrae]|uniref:Porin family protein n=1 Tax=Ferrovibrio terrae TaxID=2594003 RepID=A0A516H5J6_9PROT|nr:porin family protein [Ferrovibrio terrae]QDO99017.1 porin family protein [Ferrovibrio terrae]